MVEGQSSTQVEREQWADKYRHVDTKTAVARVHHAREVPIIRVLRRLIKPTHLVLEAGSGSGRLANHVANEFAAKVIGVDFSPEGNQLGLRTAAALRCSSAFTSGDLTRLPFPDSVFDVVFSDSVIEHLEQTEWAIAEMARVTRPGGRVVVTTPNTLRPDGWNLYKWRFKPPYLQKSFRLGELKQMFARSGMHIEQTFGDTLILPRSFQRNSGVSRSDAAPPRRVNSSALRLRYLQVERLAEWVVPPSLWINIGLVARKL